MTSKYHLIAGGHGDPIKHCILLIIFLPFVIRIFVSETVEMLPKALQYIMSQHSPLQCTQDTSDGKPIDLRMCLFYS